MWFWLYTRVAFLDAVIKRGDGSKSLGHAILMAMILERVSSSPRLFLVDVKLCRTRLKTLSSSSALLCGRTSTSLAMDANRGNRRVLVTTSFIWDMYPKTTSILDIWSELSAVVVGDSCAACHTLLGMSSSFNPWKSNSSSKNFSSSI